MLSVNMRLFGRSTHRRCNLFQYALCMVVSLTPRRRAASRVEGVSSAMAATSRRALVRVQGVSGWRAAALRGMRQGRLASRLHVRRRCAGGGRIWMRTASPAPG
jgi:hypothetical protein